MLLACQFQSPKFYRPKSLKYDTKIQIHNGHNDRS